MILTERAPAKVNLTLHVTGRNANGYHLLDSLVVFTEVGDILSASPSDSLTLEIDGLEAADLTSGPDNLIWQAATLMGAEGIALRLHKYLPLASGIGGGSSDAAACLRLVARMTDGEIPPVDQVATLGADVPVCLLTRFSRMQGVGDRLTLLDAIPDFWLVLVNPRVQVSTPEVFRALTKTDNPPMPAVLPDWRTASDLFDWLRDQRNDLQDPACSLVPEITQVLDAIRETDCALARMSGSGATCFGLYDAEEKAQCAARDLSFDHPQWWVRPTALLPGQ